MEEYKNFVSIMRDIAHEESVKAATQTETYQEIYMELESISSPEELWTSLTLEQEKARRRIAEYGSYEKWFASRAKLAAVMNAEKWLKKLEVNGG